MRTLTTVTGKEPRDVIDKYSVSMRVMHWTMATFVIVAVGAVLSAQKQPKTEEGNKKRSDLMFLHQSCGITVAMLLPIRMYLRATSSIPPMLPSPAWMQMAALSTHYGFYVFLTIMAITGSTMGWYNGRGQPFFFTTLKGAETPDPALSKRAWWWHKQTGYYGKFIIPLHIGGAITHFAMGQKIFARMNPFLF